MNEKNYFYHGSISSNITELKALSLLHDENKKVLYLTDNIPYALFYIWDGKHNNYDRKFVTGWIKNGITYYEELFPMQLEIFYKGVSGYLYCVKKYRIFCRLIRMIPCITVKKIFLLTARFTFRIYIPSLWNMKLWVNSSC